MRWNFFRSNKTVVPSEVKSLAVPDTLSLMGVIPSASGISVSAAQAFNVPAVSCAIRTISEACATLDPMVKAIAGDGSETDAPDHPVARLLQGDCCDWKSGFELIADLVGDALISDAGGFALVNRSADGRILEITPLRRGNVTVERDQLTGEPTYSLQGKPLLSRDLINVASPLGRAPLGLAREAIGTAVALDRHAAHLFGRGAKPSGVLSFPRGMAEDAVHKIRQGWAAAQETGGGGRTAVLFDGAEFAQHQLTSTDSQFIENRLFQIQEIARAFNLPSAMLGDLSRATWANLESKHREFWSTTLEPWLRTLEAALNRALFIGDERGRFRVSFDRDDFGRADLSSRATSINGLIASRTLSPNEGRAWLGLAPRDGGDEYLNPHISAAAPDAPAAQEDASDDA